MHRTLGLLAAPTLTLLLGGCVAFGRWSSVEGNILFTDERPLVQVVSAEAGGKNFFVPSTIVLTSGRGRKLSLLNATAVPHGFQIPSLGIELILQPGVETPLDLPALEAGRIYAINCHLHPPHRGASLVVLPAAPAP